MKKTKMEKGITLVALIITIVVLLILAVVSIGAVRNSKIIGHATNTSDAWKQAQANEAALLAEYENSFPGNWEISSDGTIKNKVTGEEKKLGDTIDNAEVLEATGGTKSTYTGTWTIIGVENGKLKLVTTTNAGGSVELGKNDPKAPSDEELEEIFDKAGEGESKDVEKAIWSYQHVEETLNNYAKERTGIESAKSITIEDIEEILNITEEKKEVLGSSYNYGTTYRYFYESLKVKSQNKSTGSDKYTGTYTTSLASQVFVDKQGNAVVVDSEYKDEGVELDSNYYKYSDAFTDTKFADSLGIGYYWLVSPCVFCGSNSANFWVLKVYNGGIGYVGMFCSNGDTSGSSNGIRAVVYI